MPPQAIIELAVVTEVIVALTPAATLHEMLPCCVAELRIPELNSTTVKYPTVVNACDPPKVAVTVVALVRESDRPIELIDVVPVDVTPVKNTAEFVVVTLVIVDVPLVAERREIVPDCTLLMAVVVNSRTVQ